jgi:predicted PurR-regulated permease PerM
MLLIGHVGDERTAIPSHVQDDSIKEDTYMNVRQIFTATLVVLATLIGAYLLIANISIFVILLLAILIASALRPVVMRFAALRLPYALAILVSYLLLAVIVLLLFVVVLPPVVTQFANYMENDWQLVNRLLRVQRWIEETATTITGAPVALMPQEDLTAAVDSALADIRRSAPMLLSNLGSVLGNTALVFVMGVYWLTARENTISLMVEMFPPIHRGQTRMLIDRIETALGGYVRGVVLVAAFVGLANFVILALFRIPNAATLAFIIGVTTMLPVVGGFVGAGTATLLAALINPVHGLVVLGTFVVVQQIEMNYLTPRVMSQSVGIDPLLVFLAVFVGFAMYGSLGAVIAVPITGALAILFDHFVIQPRKLELEYKVVDGGVLLGEAPPPPPPPPTEPETPIVLTK